MSGGVEAMMERWAEEYNLQKERNKKQMSFEFDMDRARERELNDHLDKTYGYKAEFDPDFFDECKAERYEQAQREYREWLEAKECND